MNMCFFVREHKLNASFSLLKNRMINTDFSRIWKGFFWRILIEGGGGIARKVPRRSCGRQVPQNFIRDFFHVVTLDVLLKSRVSSTKFTWGRRGRVRPGIPCPIFKLKVSHLVLLNALRHPFSNFQRRYLIVGLRCTMRFSVSIVIWLSELNDFSSVPRYNCVRKTRLWLGSDPSPRLRS